MPRRKDITSVLVIGSGPIVIGQAAEFDYSGTQACRVLRAEGVRVILVNSNPATIMTDPGVADATYVEPITPEIVEAIIAKERPDAVLATLGGQTALNTAIALDEAGVLTKYGCPLIGANVAAIQLGEDRQAFKGVVKRCGADVARSAICHSMGEVLSAAEDLGYPVVVRPSFTMGGLGSGFGYDEVSLRRIAGAGLQDSPTTEVLLEESIIGWKEYELEVMRDTADNVVVVCSIENLDPMGVHTGDSITVAPAMTLTDREYQNLRDIGIAIIREVGVDTGGCNIQFAVNPEDGRVIVIEMNPRVSRSSALASKATGFPIAKIAAKMALGYTLDEVPNDITGATPASFEPTLDYVVVKVPRFAFEKFPAADRTLTTTMKSVGEAMAIGRNFAEALNKALRSTEQAGSSFHWRRDDDPGPEQAAALLEQARTPTDGRLVLVQQALRGGVTVAEAHAATGIDPWFLDQLVMINEVAAQVWCGGQQGSTRLAPEALRRAKRIGLSDAQVAELTGTPTDVVRGVRHALGIRPVYKTVDTCAGEFVALTPYHYSSYDSETEVAPRERPAVLILGSGPNRIGQGIEFDYSCVHASMALRDAGFDTVMVNCNPETVSTDYDTSSRLYFEPLTLEDVLEVVHAERQAGPLAGVVVQLGGQTPLGLAAALKAEGVPIVGTSPEAIHLAEDRGAFGRVLAQTGLSAPRHGMAYSVGDAASIAQTIGYPVLVRPSYVLGGRGMEIVYDEASLQGYVGRALQAAPEHPVLIDRFLDEAV
ncbi:MAG: carbamoyl-phosphate synthase large subunit, partial [Ornithinimicrobium sp.]